MVKGQNNKPIYDLEERTLQFAKDVRLFVKTLPKTMADIEDGKQVIKASGSVGANYREANEALSKKDFVMRIKICRKEAKESAYWLRLINETNNLKNADEAQSLRQEANPSNIQIHCKKMLPPAWFEWQLRLVRGPFEFVTVITVAVPLHKSFCTVKDNV